MHSFPLTGELAEWMKVSGECGAIEVARVDGIPGSMSENLLDEDEFGVLCVERDEEGGD